LFGRSNGGLSRELMLFMGLKRTLIGRFAMSADPIRPSIGSRPVLNGNADLR
jgi:hypothetical protein